MDSLQQFKEKVINDYLSSIDMTAEYLDANQIKRELKSKLGEEPAIKFNYESETMLKEDGSGEKVRVEKLESMTIIFTVDKEIAPGQTAPFPVTQTFIVG
jgi:hypothetical protein